LLAIASYISSAMALVRRDSADASALSRARDNEAKRKNAFSLATPAFGALARSMASAEWESAAPGDQCSQFSY